jgi:hypothetical protein
MTDLTMWKSMPVFLASAYWSYPSARKYSVEIGQIVRVEDNALSVDFGIPHPKRMKEPELLA